MDHAPVSRRAVAGALFATLLVTIGAFGSVAAANPDDLTVSGQSQSTITLTLADANAQFGTNLTPTGTPSNMEADVVTTAAAGACYEWDSTVTVSSNVAYDVTVDPVDGNANLDFMVADPGNYPACTGGTAIETAAFTPFANQAVTASRPHGYWLGLNVAWIDGPSLSLGAATLTFEAIADV
jgi:D-alanyl-D-alanine carboxypeptidase